MRALKTLVILLCLLPFHAVGAASSLVWQPYDPETIFQGRPDKEITLVHVHAHWCSSCKVQIRPLETVLNQEEFRHIRTIRVDYDDDKGFKRTYGVEHTTTLVMFKGSIVLGKAQGVLEEDLIRQVLHQGLKKAEGLS